MSISIAPGTVAFQILNIVRAEPGDVREADLITEFGLDAKEVRRCIPRLREARALAAPAYRLQICAIEKLARDGLESMIGHSEVRPDLRETCLEIIRAVEAGPLSASALSAALWNAGGSGLSGGQKQACRVLNDYGVLSLPIELWPARRDGEGDAHVSEVAPPYFASQETP